MKIKLVISSLLVAVLASLFAPVLDTQAYARGGRGGGGGGGGGGRGGGRGGSGRGGSGGSGGSGGGDTGGGDTGGGDTGSGGTGGGDVGGGDSTGGGDSSGSGGKSGGSTEKKGGGSDKAKEKDKKNALSKGVCAYLDQLLHEQAVIHRDLFVEDSLFETQDSAREAEREKTADIQIGQFAKRKN